MPGEDDGPETIVCRTPVLCTRIEGAIGMLGADYPGTFEVGDAPGLTALRLRSETDPAFLATLSAHCDKLRPTYAPENERRIWAGLLVQLVGRGPLAQLPQLEKSSRCPHWT